MHSTVFQIYSNVGAYYNMLVPRYQSLVSPLDQTLTAVLSQQRLQLLASLDENLEGATFDPQAEVESEAFQVDAVGGEQFHVTVVDEADAVEVDDAQIGCVSFDLSYVDHFVDLFLRLVSEFESS